MPVLPEFPRCSYLQTGEIFKSKNSVSRHMTQGSGHPLDGGDEPKSVNVGNIFTEGISLGFAEPAQFNTDNMQQQIQTNQNLLDNQAQDSVQNPIDANRIMIQNQQMFGGTISGSVGQGFWDHKSEKPKNGEKTKQFLVGVGIPTAVFILSAIIIISTDPYTGNSWGDEYSEVYLPIDQSTSEPQMFELGLSSDQFVYSCSFYDPSISHYRQQNVIDCWDSTDYYIEETYYDYGGYYYETPVTGVFYHYLDIDYDLNRITLDDGIVSIPGENLSVDGVLMLSYRTENGNWERVEDIMPSIENNSTGIFYDLSEYHSIVSLSGGFSYQKNNSTVWIDYNCESYSYNQFFQCAPNYEIEYTTVQIGNIYSENQTAWIAIPEEMDVISVSFYIFDESEMITDSDWLMYEIASVAMPILSFFAVIATAVVGFSNNRKSQGWGAISSIIVAPAIFVISSIIYLIFFW